MIINRLTPLLLFLLVLSPVQLVVAGSDVSAASAVPIHVEQQFAEFSHRWIDKIDRNFAFRLGQIQTVPHAEGFIGRYMQVDRDSVAWSVKTSSNSPVSYIGILEYLEWTYECLAPTRDAVEQGPFVRVHGRQVTEIFQYGQNKWIE